MINTIRERLAGWLYKIGDRVRPQAARIDLWPFMFRTEAEGQEYIQRNKEASQEICRMIERIADGAMSKADVRHVMRVSDAMTAQEDYPSE